MNKNNKNQLDFATSNFINEEKLDSSFFSFQEELIKISMEMEAGLTGKISSLPMLNTNIKANSNMSFKNGESKVVIDAGGTNLRIVKIIFNQGIPEIVYWEKYAMPGGKTEGKISKDIFFNRLVEYLSPVIKDQKSLNFCYSYPIFFNNKGEAIAQELNKEVEIEGLTGSPICNLLLNKLHQYGYTNIKKIIILNDTTATFLAGKLYYPNYHNYLGLVLGTGFNISYQENLLVKNIIINTECGSYNGLTHTEFDRILDCASNFPSEQLLEKKLSGKYLGSVFLESIKLAFSKKYFSKFEFGNFKINQNRFLKLKRLSTNDLSIMLTNLEKFKIKFELLDNEEFFFILYRIAEAHIYRVAKITAIMAASFILRSFNITSKDILLNNSNNINFSGFPVSLNKKICINLDGSVINNLKSLKKLFKNYLEEILNDWKIEFDLIAIENSPIMGSTMAEYNFIN